MQHLADSMTELCHSGKHNNACGESIPTFYTSGEEAKLVVIGRGRYLSVCQGVNVTCNFVYWNGNKVIRDLVQHLYN